VTSKTPPDIDRVLVAGASGGTGREILRILASRPVTVRAMTRRDAAVRPLERAGADEVVVGDLFERADAERAVEDVDAVLSAVGSGARDVLSGDAFVDGRGNRVLFEAAAATGVGAVVMESALGVGDEPTSPLGETFNLFIGQVQRAKSEAEATLRNLPVRHTIFRPGLLTPFSRTDDVQVAAPGAKLWGAVPRADVARVMAAAPVTAPAAHATFELVSNPLLRDRSLDLEWRLPGHSAEREEDNGT
jgi:uncharacterized protein YbjT (DUF2867 family)